MEIITSVKNPIVIQTRKIKKDSKDKLFLEGAKIIKEAYLSNHKIEYSLILEKVFNNFPEEFRFLLDRKFYIVSENVLKSLCDTISPQGIVSVVEFCDKTLDEPQGNFLVLENLQDAGNVGTIIRSAVGTDFRDVYLINCVNVRNQKVVRSSMGGIFKVNLFSLNTTDEFLSFKNKYHLNYLTATMQGEDLFDLETKLPDKIGVVVGNEGNGVSNIIKENSYKQVSIPMKNGLESLNAGVSCSIIMYYLDNLKKIKGETKNDFSR